jgi:hypothetical protein
MVKIPNPMRKTNGGQNKVWRGADEDPDEEERGAGVEAADIR